MRLEMGGVNHQLVGFAALGGELGEDAVEHTQAAPPYKPV
jgi:hypothetical protein